jgi:hypothetical protein
MVNDQYITQLDLTRHLTERGYICVATGFEVGDEREGETTVYSDFRQWKLPRLDKLQ